MVGRNWRKVLVGGIAAAFMAVLAIGFTGVMGETEAIRVDETDVISESCCEDARSGYSTPTLRVAIAAMISPETTKQYYGDLMRLIGKRLGRRTVFLQRKTYAEVNHLLEAKEVDIAFVCAGPYVDGHDKFGMEILAVPVVNGERYYRSLFIVHRDSDIQNFDGLKGKRFAFTDPDSNTGRLVPRFVLAERGTTAEKFFRETFFTNSHDNSIKAVADGLADGAAVDSLVWEFMKSTEPEIVGRTRVVHSSPRYGIPPVVVHPHMADGVKKELRETFVSLHGDATASPLLRELRIERFEDGKDEAYDKVREMRDWVALNSGTGG